MRFIMSNAVPVSDAALAVRQTRERYKARGLRQINTMLDEQHTKLFSELVGDCDGHATKRTVQEALSLLYSVRKGFAVVNKR